MEETNLTENLNEIKKLLAFKSYEIDNFPNNRKKKWILTISALVKRQINGKTLKEIIEKIKKDRLYLSKVNQKLHHNDFIEAKENDIYYYLDKHNILFKSKYKTNKYTMVNWELYKVIKLKESKSFSDGDEISLEEISALKLDMKNNNKYLVVSYSDIENTAYYIIADDDFKIKDTGFVESQTKEDLFEYILSKATELQLKVITVNTKIGLIYYAKEKGLINLFVENKQQEVSSITRIGLSYTSTIRNNVYKYYDIEELSEHKGLNVALLNNIKYDKDNNYDLSNSDNLIFQNYALLLYFRHKDNNKINHQITEEEFKKIKNKSKIENISYYDDIHIPLDNTVELKVNRIKSGIHLEKKPVIKEQNHMDMSIIKEADELLNGDRAKDYGDVADNFKSISEVANVLLKSKGIVLDEIDICNVLIALKIAREGNKHKKDNLVDLAAYANIKQVLINNK